MQNFLTRVIALVAGVAVGTGIVIGALTLLQDDEGSIANTLASGPNDEERDPSTRSDASNGSTNLAAASSIHEIVLPEQAFDRKVAILATIATQSDDQLLSWLEQSTDPSWKVSPEILNEIQYTLLQKLTMTAPQRAIEFVWALDDQRRTHLASVVFLTWANLDLEDAIENVKQWTDDEAENFLPTILRAQEGLTLERQREIAKELGDENYAFVNHFKTLVTEGVEDPRETWFEIVSLANSESVQGATGNALSELAVAWVEREGMEVLDEIVASISHTTEYDFALTQIFSALSEENPEEIFDFALNNLGDRAHSILQGSSVIFYWAQKDPKAVLAKAETLPASGFTRNLVWRVIWQWADDNPRQILKEIELVPGEHQAQARYIAIQALTRSSPDEAAKLVLQEQDPQTRATLANSLISTWAYQDSEAAKDWVLGLPTSDPLRSTLVRPLAMALVYSDPREAFRLALEQPIDENPSLPYSSTGYESSIISMLAYQDVDLAIELLPQVRNQGRSMAYSTVGSSLIQKGEARQAINLANQLPQEEQVNYFRSMSSTWAWQDPQGLLKAFDDFPSAEIKSRVAMTVSMMNTTSNIYSDEELASFEKYMTQEMREKIQQFHEIDMQNPSPEDRKLLQELYSW